MTDSDHRDQTRLSTQPGADPADVEEIEAERQERLDPENRPEDAEVDNTDREFDAEKGMYTDSEGYERAEEKFPPLGEQGAWGVRQPQTLGVRPPGVREIMRDVGVLVVAAVMVGAVVLALVRG
jgi:hypothetical protein